MKSLTVLIIGGYGTFGRRLVELLQDEQRLTLIVAGRSLARANAYVVARQSNARLVPATFDRNGDAAAQLAVLMPDVVIDASGPFQAYGRGYAVVEACIAARIHYLDLADGAEFVGGIGACDAAAKAAGVFALSGVSTCPALTAAAVRHLSRDMQKVDSIRGGIAPSPRAGVGENVVRAIASYAGKRVTLRKAGRDAAACALIDAMKFTVAPPGCIPLKRNRFSLVSVPDLSLLRELWPNADVWFGAGPRPAILHRVLSGFAWAVRLRVLPSLSPFAKLMHWATQRLRWGEHRGGMFVEVSGRRGSEPKTRSWHLIAEGDDGPSIPSMASAAIIRKMLQGQTPAPGARPAIRELELDDFAPMFRARSIWAGVRETSVASDFLYKRFLGSTWNDLPAEIRVMHEVKQAEGRAIIDRGTNPLAKLIGAVIGFPKAGTDVPLTVQFDMKEGVETWTRTFAGKSFHSIQYEGQGGAERLICERFGPLAFAMALPLEKGTLRLVLRRWTAFGIPMPMTLAPRVNAFEHVEDGRFRFHSEIVLPFVGLVVRYRGWLVPR